LEGQDVDYGSYSKTSRKTVGALTEEEEEKENKVTLWSKGASTRVYFVSQRNFDGDEGHRMMKRQGHRLWEGGTSIFKLQTSGVRRCPSKEDDEERKGEESKRHFVE